MDDERDGDQKGTCLTISSILSAVNNTSDHPISRLTDRRVQVRIEPAHENPST